MVGRAPHFYFKLRGSKLIDPPAAARRGGASRGGGSSRLDARAKPAQQADRFMSADHIMSADQSGGTALAGAGVEPQHGVAAFTAPKPMRHLPPSLFEFTSK